MKQIKNSIIALVMALGLVAVVPATTTGAINVYKGCSGSQSAVCKDPNGEKNVNGGIKKIVNLLLYILGAIAVIAIVIGGLRYVVSGGDSGAVKGAKDMILYAVVGLIVAVLAYSIVNFVVGAF